MLAMFMTAGCLIRCVLFCCKLFSSFLLFLFSFLLLQLCTHFVCVSHCVSLSFFTSSSSTSSSLFFLFFHTHTCTHTHTHTHTCTHTHTHTHAHTPAITRLGIFHRIFKEKFNSSKSETISQSTGRGTYVYLVNYTICISYNTLFRDLACIHVNS